jgi:hypothetical protein
VAIREQIANVVKSARRVAGAPDRRFRVRVHLLAERSVWSLTNDLGALDLIARSGADRVYGAGADRQIGIGAGWFAARGFIEWGDNVPPHENGGSAC